MKTQTTQKVSTWNMMVHAPFKKIVAYDLLCMAIGAAIGGLTVAAFLLS